MNSSPQIVVLAPRNACTPVWANLLQVTECVCSFGLADADMGILPKLIRQQAV